MINPDTAKDEEARTVDDHRQIKLLLKEAGMYLQFLTEDMDAVESIPENMLCKIEQLLQEATKKLRESTYLSKLELRGGRKK